MKPQTKEEVLACLKKSIENGKKLLQIIVTADDNINGGDPSFADDVFNRKHSLRLLKSYFEDEGEDSPGFFEVYYVNNDEGVKSLMVSVNLKSSSDPERSDWNTFETPYDNIEDVADSISEYQNILNGNNMLEGTVWDWKNIDLEGKVFEVKVKKEDE